MKLKNILLTSSLMLSLLGLQSTANAVSLDYIRVGDDERSRLTDIYSQAYGMPAYQVRPALAGPVGEAPAILQIAKSAGTLPLTVWTMRRMGMSYSNILSSFALAPTIYAGSQVLPRYTIWTDPMIIRMGRLHFVRDVIHVNPTLIPYFPLHNLGFVTTLLYPYHPRYGEFLPPGIAKKYGLWIPPGQRKKMGFYPGWDHPGKGNKGWGHPGHGFSKPGKGYEQGGKNNRAAFGKAGKAQGGSFNGGAKGKGSSRSFSSGNSKSFGKGSSGGMKGKWK